MTVNGIGGANGNMQAGRFGMNIQAGRSGMNIHKDSVSKNLQNQIADAQKRLQELSSDENMTIEEKMKKRQEIQQQITDLNQQLRQHQIEQRKEKQQNKSGVDDMLGGRGKAPKAGKQGSGLSQASMQAMISADTSMKQARVQGGMATRMEGQARVLESEIKSDKKSGINTEKKEEELADLKANAESATASQISTLTKAGQAMEEAAKEENRTEAAESRNDKANQAEASGKKKSDKTEANTGSVSAASSKEEPAVTVELPEAQTVKSTAQAVMYTPIDIRL